MSSSSVISFPFSFKGTTSTYGKRHRYAKFKVAEEAIDTMLKAGGSGWNEKESGTVLTLR